MLNLFSVSGSRQLLTISSWLGRLRRPPRRYRRTAQLNRTMNDTETPRIYVACLSAYTNSHLHGEWIDVDRDSDEIDKDIKAMLSRSPMAKIQACEEWAIVRFVVSESR
jgi:antirestriction protein